MIPLLWLVTSSFKTANEIFAVPIKWLPDLPPRLNASPYVRQDAYSSIQKPEALDNTTWMALREQLPTLLWDRAQKYLVGKPYDPRLETEAREEMIQGLWSQLIARLSNEVWKQSASDIASAIRDAVIPEATLTIWDSLYREVALGAIQIEDVNFNQIPVEMVQWEKASDNVTDIRLQGNTSDPLVSSEFGGQSSEGKTELRTQHSELARETAFSYHFNLHNAARFAATISSPVPIDRLRLIRISVRGDASYHHLRCTVESNGAAYRSSKPFVLSDALWRNSVWRLRGQPSVLESDHIIMSPFDFAQGRPEEGASARTNSPNELRLQLEIYRPSYLAICWDKFTANYRRLWETVPYSRYFINSVFISTASTLITLFFCSLAGYAFAKHRFRGQKILFGLLLASMMIPFQVLLVPLFRLMYDIRWLNSYKAIIIPFSIGAFGIFLMRQFIVGIPSDLIDAARIDGCSEFGIYYRIILPVIKPALGALTIYSFLGSWNSYLWPLIILRDEAKYTLPLGLANLVGVYRQEYGLLMAGTLLSLLPIIILFLAMQREFVQGITLGSVKE
jgi:ABC-type glycerol-3-phosphate transport system permease component